MEKSLNFYQKIVSLGINRKLKPDNDMEIVFLGGRGNTNRIDLQY